MKGIRTLIRLAKRDLDELRKRQGALEVEKAKLLQALRKSEDELQREMTLAAKSPEMGSFYGGFSKRTRNRQALMHQEVQKVETKLVALSEEIRAAFADLKKYELAEAQSLARIKSEAERKERIELDEIATTRFIRQQEEG